VDHKITAIERAFQIAKSGHAPNVDQIKVALLNEGYPSGRIDGPSLSKQLTAIIAVAREDRAESSKRRSL
jgi:hypothetical protein